MREHYIPNKVDSLFHAKHPNAIAQRLDGDGKIASIMSFVHDEIQKANTELNIRVMRKIYLCLKEKL